MGSTGIWLAAGGDEPRDAALVLAGKASGAGARECACEDAGCGAWGAAPHEDGRVLWELSREPLAGTLTGIGSGSDLSTAEVKLLLLCSSL